MSRGVPRLLAITGPAGPSGSDMDLDPWLEALGRSGVDGLQVRRKELGGRALLALAVRARAALPAPAAVVVNGRLDVALAAGAAGVHLPAAGLPTREVRRLAEALGADVLIGRSTHHPDEVARARDEGADYALFGPVWATPGKERPSGAVGLAALERAAAHGLPVLALGGVEPGRFAELAVAGARGAAGIRMFRDAGGLGRLAREAARVFPPPAER
ncbi:MAG TPA: thiamine phosphate synthase [Thermoanaerobaculia bacterium]|nr:thiamine phosphate synthase [Thermoanaerobaculia bacterium]